MFILSRFTDLDYGAMGGKSSLEDAERDLLEADKEYLCSGFFLRLKCAISYKWQTFKDYLAPFAYVVRTFLGLPGKEQLPTADSHKRAFRYIILLSCYCVPFNIFLVFACKWSIEYVRKILHCILSFLESINIMKKC